MNIKFTDKTLESNLSVIGTVVLIVISAILGFGFLPGFLFASLLDCITILRTGQIWGTVILSSIVIAIGFIRFHKATIKGLKWYIGLAAILLLIFILGLLFTEGNIFYSFTFQKMLAFGNNPFGSIEKIEQRRGRFSNCEELKGFFWSKNGVIIKFKYNSNNYYDYRISIPVNNSFICGAGSAIKEGNRIQFKGNYLGDLIVDKECLTLIGELSGKNAKSIKIDAKTSFDDIKENDNPSAEYTKYLEYSIGDCFSSTPIEEANAKDSIRRDSIKQDSIRLTPMREEVERILK